MTAARSIVCIAGMHRSGTSLTASWLHRCGLPVDLGRREGPQVGNRAGEFEDVDLRNLHARAIGRAHRGSGGWRVTDPAPLRFAPLERAALRVQLRRRDRRFAVWGFKDPRSAFFLDEWVRVRPRLTTLVVWRPQADVVDSLLRRAAATDQAVMQVTAPVAAQVWEATTTRLVAHAEARPDTTVVVSLSALLEADSVVFDLLGERTGWDLTRVPLSEVHRPSELQAPDRRSASGALTPRGAELEDRLRDLGADLGPR